MFRPNRWEILLVGTSLASLIVIVPMSVLGVCVSTGLKIVENVGQDWATLYDNGQKVASGPLDYIFEAVADVVGIEREYLYDDGTVERDAA